MIVVMEVNASEDQSEAVIERMIELGFNPSRTTGKSQSIIAGVGHGEIDLASFQEMDGVSEAFRVSSPYKLASRVWKRAGTQVSLGGVRVGGPRVVAMARACQPAAVNAAADGGAAGVIIPASKARIGYEAVSEERLTELRAAAAARGLFLVVEVTSPSQVAELDPHCDAFLVIASQMQNYALLGELGALHKPVILERSLSASIEDWLMAAECILSGGNGEVILCERGIRTFDTLAPVTLDITAIPAVHRLSHLPVIADPLRGTGRKDRVLPVACAAVAAGADGVVLDPGPEFAQIAARIHKLAEAMGREG